MARKISLIAIIPSDVSRSIGGKDSSHHGSIQTVNGAVVPLLFWMELVAAQSSVKSCATLGARSSASMWLPSSKLSSDRNFSLAAYLLCTRVATSRWR